MTEQRATAPWTPIIAECMPNGEMTGAAWHHLLRLVREENLSAYQWHVAAQRFTAGGIVCELKLWKYVAPLAASN